MTQTRERAASPDAGDIKRQAAGREVEVLEHVAGIPAEMLDGRREHPCPKCGGNTRFRLVDPEAGSVYCSHCFSERNGDYLSAIQWMHHCTFPQAVRLVTEYLDGTPTPINGKPRPAKESTPVDINKGITWTPDRDDEAFTAWCSTLRGRGCSPHALAALGAFSATWYGTPVIGFTSSSSPGRPANGIVLMREDGTDFPATAKLGARKTHMIGGSRNGWTGTPITAKTTRIVKTEGYTDLVALVAAGVPEDTAAFSNSCGAGAVGGLDFTIGTGREVYVVGDADAAGSEGAAKFSTGFLPYATAVFNVPLPFPPDSKADLRDYLHDEHGTFEDLTSMAMEIEKPDDHEDDMPEYLRYEEASLSDFEEPEPPAESSSRSTGGASKKTLPDIAHVHGQTDSAHAAKFIDQYHRELLYVPAWKKWLSWDGTRWADDNGVGVLQRAKRYAKSLWADLAQIAPMVNASEVAKIVTAIKAVNQTNKIHAFLELAAVDERVVCNVEELNTDPTLLNVANGTLDLEAGRLRPHNPADRITQLADVVYDPNAKCPEWTKTLSLIFNGDGDVIRYVQKLLGYSISGDTGEHILPIAWGRGCNGKSTVWGVVADLLGDYATLANDELLLGAKSMHPTEKVSLYQMRFVAISEPERDSALRESRVKELTGDRMITGRRMREDFWTFQRTHTFWLSTNHLPRINGIDEGIWRRIKLIPFTVDLRQVITPIPDYDTWLTQNEGRGILAWLVQGYLAYRREGLREPQAVLEATGHYREDSDVLGDFLDEYCVDDPNGEILVKELYKAYTDQGGKWTSTAFGKALSERYEKVRPDSGEHRKKTVYRGIRFRDVFDESDPPSEPATEEGTDEKIPGKTGLPIVAHSLGVPPIENPFPRDKRNNCGQLWAEGKVAVCDHSNPSTFVPRDGKAFCPSCGRFMGRLPQGGPS